MINRMVLRNLLHRPIRTGLSVLAVAIELSMILLIVGLAEGLLEQSHGRTRSIGADILIRPSVSSTAMALGTADIPEKMAGKLAEMFPDVELAMGVVVQTPGDLQTITGADWEKFLAMTGGVRYYAGGPLQDDHDAIVDEVYARHRKLAIGDTLRLLNRDFTLVGVIEAGKMSRIFIRLDTMQELMGWQGKFSQVFLKLYDPEQTRDVIAQIKQVLPNYPVYAIEDFLALAAADVREMSAQFIDAIVGIAVSIGFLVVLLSMYTAVLERTREIGILKSLGASKSYIVGLVMRETILIACAGVLVGVGISYLSKALIESRFPLITILIPNGWILWGACIALIGALAGAFYPAARAARQDPIDALAYE